MLFFERNEKNDISYTECAIFLCSSMLELILSKYHARDSFAFPPFVDNSQRELIFSHRSLQPTTLSLPEKKVMDLSILSSYFFTRAK
jgi:hypothetical protein